MREIEVPARPSKLPWIVVAVAALGIVGLLVTRKSEPPQTERIEVRGPPDVVVAMRDLSKLETSSFHIEKVIEMTDVQKSLLGMVDSTDALLLVAVGEGVAGVDLEKLDGNAVKSDWTKKTVTVTLGLDGSGLTRREHLLIGWFWIRGFVCVYYLMFEIYLGLPAGVVVQVSNLTLVVIALSIVTHGMSVTPLMRHERPATDAQAAP